MFHSKQDVDRHVNEVFRNIKSEYQRNLKCYQIAKLYFKFKDYKAALKYINRYILTTSNSAAAHRLLGECYLGLNLKVKAIEAFKASLVLNGSQNDLVLKICTLLMDPDVSAVTPRTTYWLERAETLFPTNPIVFQLREHLLKSNLEGKQDMGQLEKLILSEISARPADVTVRIRLLKFFVDTKRFKIAYQHALEIEERNIFSHDPQWYDCLCNVLQAYEKSGNDVVFMFFIKKIIFLEKRADLFMQEFQEEIKTLSECSAALFAFDQNLHSFAKIEAPQEDKYFFTEFLKHMRTQLSFHLATLILKRAKKEHGMWPKALRSASPLLLQATQNTMDLEEAWFSMWPGKNKLEKEVNQLNKSATLRISQAGHVLLAWSQSKGSKFLEKVSQFCGGKWQTTVYQDIFYNREHQQAVATSHFANDPFFASVPMRLLTDTELSHFDEVSQSAYPDSLHHLVWLGLSYCNSTGCLNHDFRCRTVPDLQFSVANLSQVGPETLNQLDVDAFLYASVLCAKSFTPSIVSTDRPNRLPVSISEELCSPAQADWWVAVYKTYTNQSSGNIGDMRLKLRKGIEVIRVVGQHGLHPKIMVSLAKLFQERAAKSKNSDETSALEDRTFMYWSAAIPALEKLEKNQQLREVPNRLFDYRGKDLTSNEIKTYLEDGRLFLARRLMKQGHHENAIEAFQSLKSPYATFYQALIYEELASQEVNHRPESITSENRSRHIILLTRARDALYLTLDRLRCPSVDPNHPLNSQLQDHLDQIERQLAKIDLDINLKSGDSQSDETDTAAGPLGSDVEETLENSFNVINTSNFLNVKNQSLSRPLRQTIVEKHSNTRFEARPSPERLDAQLRHFVQTNNNGLQAIVEQLKEFRSTMQIELKDLGCVTRDLLAEMKRWNDRLEATLKRSTDVFKPEDLFELREEDYEDLNQLSQPYTPYSGYHVNRQMTGTQGTSTVTYGTPVPSPIPHVPPVIPPPENPLIPPAFYPGAHPVPPLDPSLLMYQSLGYYPPGMSYGENQNLSEFRGMGIQKGAPFAKNAFKVPHDTMPNANVPTCKVQPPNVVITSSDALPAFTSGVTPAMSVTIPPQHIRGLAPSVATVKSTQNQVHPFQIPISPQAQLVRENPTEKLNSLTPTVSRSTPSTPNAKPVSPGGETNLAKSQINVDKNKSGNLLDGKNKESCMFSSRGKLSVFDQNGADKTDVSIKIFNDKITGKARLTIQRDPGFLIYVDSLITEDMAIKPLLQNENGWILSLGNSSETVSKSNEKTGAKRQNFGIYFDTSDECKNFGNVFNEKCSVTRDANQNLGKQTTPATDAATGKGKADSQAEKSSAFISKEKSSDVTCLGGFTFASTPIIKPPELELKEQKDAPKETTKSSAFSSLSLTTTTASSEANAQPKGFFSSGIAPGENLFAAVKADPNSFKKDANFKEFGGKGSLVFGYLQQQEPDSKASENEKDDSGDHEFEPTAEFTPVIDLPDLVDVKTGEENDKVLLDERAKLLRFDKVAKEWKERGVGCMRILLNEETGKVRLIMRRELVLKVCCNHYLNEKMEFKRMTQSKKALTWYAQDYSEGELKGELFALKFANPDAMLNFERTVKEAQSQMQDGRMNNSKSTNVVEEKPKEVKPLSELFKPKPGSWECGVCLIRNDESIKVCQSCQTPKPGTESSTESNSMTSISLGKGISFPPSTVKFSFGIPQSTPTTTSASASTTTEFSFGIPKSTSTTTSFSSTPQLNMFNANSTNIGTSTPQFSFGIPQGSSITNATTTKTESVTNAFTGNIFGGSSKPSGTSVLTSTGTNSSVTQSVFGAFNSSPSTGFTFSTTSESSKTGVSSASNVPVSTSSNLFSKISSNSTPTANVKTSTASSAFTFSSSTFEGLKINWTSSGNASFSSPGLFTAGTTQSASLTGGSMSSPSFTFSTVSSTPTTSTSSILSPSIFKAGEKSDGNTGTPRWSVPGSNLITEGKEKFEFSLEKFKLSTPEVASQKTKSASPKKNDKATSEDSGGEEDADVSRENDEDNIIIKPIIPLPEKVALHTGEEDEDVLYEQRAKLFHFNDKEWKEKGVGNVKILKHKENNKIRILMRRDTVLKVCLNHYLTPEIEFRAKDEKAWTWTAADFADEEVHCTLFAIRFKTPTIAQEFKKAVDDALKTAADSPAKEDKCKDLSAAMKAFTFSIPNAAKAEPSLSSKSNKSDHDVFVTYEKTVSAEQREKAISLQLPPNFYSYLQAPDCPGCPGCDKDEEPVQTEQTPAAEPTKTTFVSKPWGSLNFGGDDNSQRKVSFTFAGNKEKTAWDAGQTALNFSWTKKKEDEAKEEEEENYENVEEEENYENVEEEENYENVEEEEEDEEEEEEEEKDENYENDEENEDVQEEEEEEEEKDENYENDEENEDVQEEEEEEEGETQDDDEDDDCGEGEK